MDHPERRADQMTDHPRISSSQRLIVGLAVLVVVLVWYHWKTTSAYASDRLLVEDEVLEGVRVGDAEGRVREFLQRKKWNSNFDAYRKAYIQEVKVGESLFESHVVIIKIVIAEQKVSSIEFSDFNRAL
jgi:hypothetical protein